MRRTNTLQTLQTPEPLVDAKVGAPVAGVKERTLREWLSQDPPPFPVTRLSARCVRFRMSDLLAWIESKTTGSRQAS